MLKGKTVIELTDVKTGQVERFEDENMVTNAVQDYLNAIIFLKGYSANSLFPVYKEVLGGIKLFENSIEEDANNYIIPSVGQNKIVGYASSTVKSNEDARRGNLNLQETTAVDNGMQLVWDFATSEANGTISCVCLTSKRGGEESYPYKTNGDEISSSTLKLDGYLDTILGYDKENDLFYSYKDQKVLKCKLNPYNIKLTQLLLEPDILEERGENVPNLSGYRMYDENTVYMTSVAWGTAKVILYDILTKEEKTTTSFSISGISVDSSGIPLVHNGYLYFTGSSYTMLYKVNLSNTSDVTAIEITGGKLAKRLEVLPNGNIACGQVIFDPESNSYDLIFSTLGEDVRPPIFASGGCSIWTGNPKIYTSDRGLIGMNNLALMTINNLQTPVTKTADKTMKITYTLLYSE